jgi:hypothetical protein
MFTLLLGLSAFLVAGSAAYFSVLGIATLFAGSYYQVMVMAAALEFGKLVATSYLYRYWTKTIWWLKLYLIVAVFALMCITSLGVFGYLSAAYQVNSSKFGQIEQQVTLLNEQKNNFDNEIAQNNNRIEVLNKARLSQEQRLPSMSRQSAAPVYADMERSATEIKRITERNQMLQDQKLVKDNEISELNNQIVQVKDIGTFKFIADSINKPLDKVVVLFICLLICVFDPLAVSLILAFNVATYGKILKETTILQTKPYNPQPHTTFSTEVETEVDNVELTPSTFKTFHGTVK